MVYWIYDYTTGEGERRAVIHRSECPVGQTFLQREKPIIFHGPFATVEKAMAFVQTRAALHRIHFCGRCLPTRIPGCQAAASDCELARFAFNQD